MRATKPTYGAACTCEPCMERDNRCFTVWYDEEIETTCLTCGCFPDERQEWEAGDGSWYVCSVCHCPCHGDDVVLE